MRVIHDTRKTIVQELCSTVNLALRLLGDASLYQELSLLFFRSSRATERKDNNDYAMGLPIDSPKSYEFGKETLIFFLGLFLSLSSMPPP